MAQFAERNPCLRSGTASLEEYNLYCTTAAGIVGEGLSALFAASGLEDSTALGGPNHTEMVALSHAMGNFLQKTNIIRDFFEDYVEGRTWWPRQLWAQHVPSLGALLPPHPGGSPSSAAVACLDHMVADALELVPACMRYLALLREPAVTRFCAIPQLMALATLTELYHNPRVFTGIVKIRPGLAAQLILCQSDATSAADARAALRRCYARFAADIEARVPAEDPLGPRIRTALSAIHDACSEQARVEACNPSASRA
jgi:farnesyl-diphosphate farnesyltransferase